MVPRSLRLAGAMLAASLCLGLAGCESFDPAMLFPDTKKPLPGERRPVFPEGVPGVTQGVPPELMRGAQQQDAQGPAVVTQQPVEEQAEKPKPKAKAKKKAAPQQAAQEAPEPRPVQQARPAQQQQAQPQASPWPSPPQPGTFTR